jgi:hypothetical protein
MRRHARAIPLARRRLNSFVLDLESKPTEEWPPHLRRARNIVCSESEPALPEEAALSLIIKSVSAAHKCGQAINQRSADIAEFQTRVKLHDPLRRIAKCAKRAPARLRRRLDKQVVALIRESVIDLEVRNGNGACPLGNLCRSHPQGRDPVMVKPARVPEI